MRRASLFGLLLVLTGVCAAQDTNFSVGPQYLITTDSPLFLRPIATPTLSFSTPPPSAAAATQESAGAQTFSTPPELRNQASLFSIYYGTPAVSVVAITQEEPPSPRPAGTVEVGVTRMTDVQSLRDLGYAGSLPAAASHKAPATRNYTNADIDRLHRD